MMAEDGWSSGGGCDLRIEVLALGSVLPCAIQRVMEIEEIMAKLTGARGGAGTHCRLRKRRRRRSAAVELRRDHEINLGHGRLRFWRKIGQAGRGEYIYGGGGVQRIDRIDRFDLGLGSVATVFVMNTSGWRR